MKTKRFVFLSLFLGLALTAVLTACGDPEETAGPAEQNGSDVSSCEEGSIPDVQSAEDTAPAGTCDEPGQTAGNDTLSPEAGIPLEPVETDAAYFVLEVGPFDGYVFGDHQVEVNAGGEWYVEDGIPPVSITVCGKTYECAYEHTSPSMFYGVSGRRYRYHGDGDGTTVSCMFSTRDGSLVMYTFSTLDKAFTGGSERESEKIDDAGYQAVIRKYLDELPAPDEYVLCSETRKEYDSLPDNRTFVYARMKNGYRTSEYVEIGITEYGDVTVLWQHGAGSMKDAIPPTDEERAAMDKCVTAKLIRIYGGQMEKYDVSYRTEDVEYIRTEEDVYGLYYRILLTFTDRTTGGQSFDTCILFVTRR